jgi:hypothetical protein
MDSLLIDEDAGALTGEQREQAIDQLLELGGAIDGLVAEQVELDIDALQTATGRSFTDDERDDIRAHQQACLPMDVPRAGARSGPDLRHGPRCLPAGDGSRTTLGVTSTAKDQLTWGDRRDSNPRPSGPQPQGARRRSAEANGSQRS